MSRNGRRRPPRPQITLTAPAATEGETAAIAAALEQFLSETAPAPQRSETTSRWRRAALIEGVSARSAAFPPQPGSGFPPLDPAPRRR